MSDVKIHERARSREQTVSYDRPTAELQYLVTGTDDELLVRAAVQGEAPAFYQGMPFQHYTISPGGNGTWEATVQYGLREEKKPGESSYSFDTGGGTQHITQSIATIAKHAPPGKTPPDCKGAIGVTSDSVDGVDITVPVYQFTETHYIPIAAVTNAYKGKLFLLTGKTNNGPFRMFAAGEVLFLGASGGQRGYEDWEITFRFAASPNATGLTVGDITAIDKKGWEYLWIRYEDAESEDALIKQPVGVYVEQVYEEADFADLGIGA